MHFVDQILKRLAELSYSDKILVIGSVAKGERDPCDLDVVVDISPLTSADFIAIPSPTVQSDVAAYLPLLRVGLEYQGHFDPSLATQDERLMVRNATQTSFVLSDASPQDVHELLASGRKLFEVMDERASIVQVMDDDTEATPKG